MPTTFAELTLTSKIVLSMLALRYDALCSLVWVNCFTMSALNLSLKVRASALSDECNALHEVFRGQLKRFSGGQQDCVRRRAVKSLEMNPNCKVRVLNPG